MPNMRLGEAGRGRLLHFHACSPVALAMRRLQDHLVFARASSGDKSRANAVLPPAHELPARAYRDSPWAGVGARRLTPAGAKATNGSLPGERNEETKPTGGKVALTIVG